MPLSRISVHNLISNLQSGLSEALTIGRRWLWWPGLVAIAVMVFIATVVRPFEVQPDPESDDIAKAWHRSIGRLGISSVYPPTEDMYVGDIWAVVAAARDAPLLGKSVRIGHIDLRKEIKAEADRMAFADTADHKPGEKYRRQDNSEITRPVADAVLLKLAAFPGITINYTARSQGGFRAASWGFGASREFEDSDEIRIPIAETYGASLISALGRLGEWCRDTLTKLRCTDEFARRVVAYAIGDGVFAHLNGEYVASIQLRLITRVFLTREIQHRRLRKGAQIADASVSLEEGTSPFASPASPVGPEASSSRNGAEQKKSSDGVGDRRSRINSVRTEGSQVVLQEVFQRPLVFGFRAATLSLPLSKPQIGAQP
jgi:hypothetical protein